MEQSNRGTNGCCWWRCFTSSGMEWKVSRWKKVRGFEKMNCGSMNGKRTEKRPSPHKVRNLVIYQALKALWGTHWKWNYRNWSWQSSTECFEIGHDSAAQFSESIDKAAIAGANEVFMTKGTVGSESQSICRSSPILIRGIHACDKHFKG